MEELQVGPQHEPRDNRHAVMELCFIFGPLQLESAPSSESASLSAAATRLLTWVRAAAMPIASCSWAILSTGAPAEVQALEIAALRDPRSVESAAAWRNRGILRAVKGEEVCQGAAHGA